jgi:hypothetical protein
MCNSFTRQAFAFQIRALTLGPEGSTVRLHFRRPGGLDGKLPKGFFHHYSVELVRGFYQQGDRPSPKTIRRGAKALPSPGTGSGAEDSGIVRHGHPSTPAQGGGSENLSVERLQQQLAEAKLQLEAALAQCHDLHMQNQTLTQELAARKELQVRLAGVLPLRGSLEAASELVLNICSLPGTGRRDTPST